MIPSLSEIRSYRIAAATLMVSLLMGLLPTTVAQAVTPSVSVSDFSAQADRDATFSVSLSNFTSGDYLVVMSVDNGALSLASTTGLTATGNFDLTDSSELGFSGSLTDIQTALTSMTFLYSESGAVALEVDVAAVNTVSVGGSGGAYAFDADNLYFNPDNGHYYEFVTGVGAVSWANAATYSSVRTLSGMTGYLATLRSASENAFVADKMSADDIWFGASDEYSVVNAAVGTIYGSQSAIEGKWYWVTGPAGERTQFMDTNSTRTSGQYSNWASGEPNNSGGEHFPVTNWNGSTGTWNDLPGVFGSVKSFVVEYGGIGTSTAESASDTATITVSQATPLAPTLTSVMGGGSVAADELSLVFSANADGGALISDFEYSIKKASDSWPGTKTWTSMGQTASPFIVDGLEEDTKYDVLVRAVNASGASESSNMETGFTVGSTVQTVLNGGFESGTANWTIEAPSSGEFIDLATGSQSSPTWEDASNKLVIDSCNILDQQDYVSVKARRSGTQYGTSQSDPWPRHDGNGPQSSSFSGSAVTELRAARIGAPTSPSVVGSKALQLSSSVSTTSGWDVVHGPAAYSDGFSGTAGDQITLDWFASYVSDDFAIQAVLLDTTDCSQTRVLSATGSSVADMKLTAANGTVTTVTSGSGWQRATLTVPETRTDNAYRFVFTSGTFDRSGGLAAGAVLYIDNISVGQTQTLTFGSQSNRGLAETPTLTASASSGGSITWGSNSPSVCTISSAGVVTFLTGGTCSITASQAGGVIGGTLYAASSAVTQTFTVEDTRLSGLSGSSTDLATAFSAQSNAATYAVSVPNATTTYAVTPTAQQAGSASITVNGVAVTSGNSSADINLEVGANAITVVVTVGSSSTTTTITVTRAIATSSTPSSSRGGSVVVPPVVIPAVPPRVTTPPGTAVPVVQSGPVLTRGVVPVPPKAPTVVLGGRPTLMSVTVPTTTQLDVKAGRLSLGVKVLEDQGTISEAPDGTTQIAVKKGASATISGSGFKPAATVQVFLPLQGDNAKELTRIPVAADGSFDGSAPFATKANEAPLPVGKQVLQLVSLDTDGNQVVVEMTVNIAQGAPAPEANRIEGVIPAMQPGQSIATSGGEPVPVTITPVSDQKLAVVEGDGWSMAVNVNSDQGGVEPAEGGALLKLVRNESALVSGSGFMPGTRADVWLFSDPTLLGTVTIDENGEFTGEVNIDPNMIPVGQHTLQLQGVGEDGYVKAANMGVLVDDPAAAVTDTATASLTFLWWILAVALLVLLLVVVLVSRRRGREA